MFKAHVCLRWGVPSLCDLPCDLTVCFTTLVPLVPLVAQCHPSTDLYTAVHVSKNLCTTPAQVTLPSGLLTYKQYGKSLGLR